MKKRHISTIAIVALLFATNCANDPIIYDGPAKMSFATATATFQVKNEPNQTLLIPVMTTVPLAEAVTVRLTITPGETETVNGTQFRCPESITFPAGVYVDTLRIAGFYDSLVTGQKYTFTIALDSSLATVQGGTTVKVEMARFCPLVIADFVGYGTCNDGNTNALLGQPTYTVALDSIPGEKNKLQLYGLFLCEPGEPGWEAITVAFDEENGTITIPAFNAWVYDPYMLRLAGATGAANVNAPITGTYNACEKKLEFSYYVLAIINATGSYGGYFNSGLPVVITWNRGF